MRPTDRQACGEPHHRFMDRALELARHAAALGEFPVGCVLVVDGEIVAEGHRSNSAARPAQELDHAEMVAMRRLLDRRPGRGLDDVTGYSTLEPCLMCYATLLVNGCRRFVHAYEDAMGGGTALDLGTLPPLYRAMQPEVIAGVRRQASLTLLQAFFGDDAMGYLRDTELARYTLAQPRSGAEST